MDDVCWLGSAPAEEDCVQVGDPDYARNAKAECRQFIDAIRKVCGPEPEGARLVVRGQSHDFGTYYECAIAFDGNDRAAAEYAARVDEKAPTTWEEAGMRAPVRGARER